MDSIEHMWSMLLNWLHNKEQDKFKHTNLLYYQQISHQNNQGHINLYQALQNTLDDLGILKCIFLKKDLLLTLKNIDLIIDKTLKLDQRT